MSSSEFSKVLVKDERLDCHPSIPFAVYKSGQNVTVATFDAISSSSASHTYNIQVPSETTVIDRRVMWQSTVTATVTVNLRNSGAAGIPTAGAVFQWGKSIGVSPYPLHTMCTTQQITINNNTVSINMNDVLPAIVKLGLDREVNNFNLSALNQSDFYGDQTGSREYANAPMSDIRIGGLDRCYRGRCTTGNVTFSSPKLNGVACQVGASGSTFNWDSVVTPGANPVTVSGTVQALGAGATTPYSFTIKIDLYEPLLCSPFIYNNPDYNGQGFYGIQNLNFVFNINANANSSWLRTAVTGLNGYSTDGDATVSDVKFDESKLIFNFLSPKPSDMLTARNVVPYWEMPRFTTSVGKVINGATKDASTGVLNGAAGSVSSQSLQLNQIPDKLIIFIRPKNSKRNPAYSDFVMAIQKISINFNNQSGILASCTQEQLWRYSVEAGSTQIWDEFRGVANVVSANTPVTDVPMLGSYLMLEFGRHIQITEDYYASGSLGNFNLQFSIDFKNYTTISFAANDLELVLITLNSGIFVTEKGQSATYTGVLTKDDVLSATASESVNERALRRMVGGSFLSKLSAVLPIANQAAQALLPDTGKMGKLKKGINIAETLRGAVQGNGRAGSRLSGSGKGSAKFDLDDRLY